MKQVEIQKLKSVIKSILKKKGMTYQDLAQELDCSLPTVNRILGPEDLTLGRTMQICDILDVTFAELAVLSEKQVEEEKQEFTPAQTQFLAKNKMFLAYLMKLYDGQTPAQIALEKKLTPRSTDKYLIALERQGLIRVTGKLRVKPTYKRLPHFGSGPLAELFYLSVIKNSNQFFSDLITEAIYRKNYPNEKKENIRSEFSVEVLKVSRESYEKWCKDQESLMRDFEKLASFEEKSKPESELMTAVIGKTHALVALNDPRLHLIWNTFGDILNL